MPINVNVNGSWVTNVTPFVYHNGSWRTIKRQGVNENGSWRPVFGDSGYLWMWGKYIGDGTTNDYSTPHILSTLGNEWKVVSSRTTNGGIALIDNYTNGTAKIGAVGDTRVTAGIKDDGTLWVWGKDEIGRFGTNETIYSSQQFLKPNLYYTPNPANTSYTEYLTPVTTYVGGNDWNDVSVGYSVVAAIKTDGTLWMWGQGASKLMHITSSQNNISYNTYIQPFSTPASANSFWGSWKQISVGDLTIGAIKTDGSLWYWGHYGCRDVRAYSGNVGTFRNYSTFSSSVSKHTPMPVTVRSNWKKVSMGRFHGGAVATDGTLWMWGSNGSGELGFVSNVQNITFPATPVQVSGTDWEDIYCGDSVTTAIKTNGTMWTWGRHDGDALGRSNGIPRLGYFNNSSTPVPIVEYASVPAKIYGHSSQWKYNSSSSSNPEDFDTFAIGSTSRACEEFTRDFLNTISRTISVNEYRNTKYIGRTTCGAIKQDGTLWMWGSDINSQLGINNNLLYVSGESDSFIGSLEQRVCLGGGDDDRHTPVQTYSGGTNWKSIHTRNGMSCGIKTDGTLWVWGWNNFNRTSSINFATRYDFQFRAPGGFSRTPIEIGNGGTWKQVSMGHDINAAIKTDGTLWYFGRGPFNTSYGIPGSIFDDGVDTRCVFESPTPALPYLNWKWKTPSGLEGGNTFFIIQNEQIDDDDLDTGHGAAIKDDGSLWLWGDQPPFGAPYGTLSSVGSLMSFAPYSLGWKEIHATKRDRSVDYSANASAMGIKTNGTLWMWGKGIDGSNKHHSLPTQIGTATDWKTGHMSHNYNTNTYTNNYTGLVYTARYGIKTNGALWCWGQKDLLGIGFDPAANGVSTVSADNVVITPIPGPSGTWKKVRTYQEYSNVIVTVALQTNGNLYEWGRSAGFLAALYSPRLVSTSVADFDIHKTSGRDAYFIKTNGTLWEWQAAHTSVDTGYLSVPTQIGTATDWSRVFAGETSYGIKTDGTLWGWGVVAYGVKRSSTNTGEYQYFPLTGNDYDKNLWQSWINDLPTLVVSGQVTDNTPRQIGTATDWLEIYPLKESVQFSATGTMGMKTDGSLWKWGRISTSMYPYTGTNNSLEIQRGNYLGSGGITPTANGISRDTNWKYVSVGRQHTAAIKTDGTLWTVAHRKIRENGWSTDMISETVPALGRGTSTNGYEYTTNGHVKWNTTNVGGTWKQVSCGNCATAAIKSDGTLWTWGYQKSGLLALGDLNIIGAYSPTPVHGGGTWKQVSLGEWHGAAIKSDGTLWVWGSNAHGQLGLNHTNEIGSAYTKWNNTEYVSVGSWIPVTTSVGGNDWLQVKCSENMTIAMRGDGTDNYIYVWGGENYLDLDRHQSIMRSIYLQDQATYVSPHIYYASSTSDVPYVNSALAQNADFDVIGQISGSWSQVNGTEEYQLPMNANLIPASGFSALKYDGSLWSWGRTTDNSPATNISYTPKAVFSQNNYSWSVVTNGAAIRRSF